VLSDQGKPNPAVAEFRKAIKLDPNHASWHNNLGNVLRDQGDPDQAAIEFNNQSGSTPDSLLRGITWAPCCASKVSPIKRSPYSVKQ
jgi:Tfp pilus assembly protein PilF